MNTPQFAKVVASVSRWLSDPGYLQISISDLNSSNIDGGHLGIAMSDLDKLLQNGKKCLTQRKSLSHSPVRKSLNTVHCEVDFKILLHLINDEIFLHLINAKLEPQLVHIVGQSWDPIWKSRRISQQLPVRRSGFSGYFRKSQSQTCVMTLSNNLKGQLGPRVGDAFWTNQSKPCAGGA